MSESVTVQTKKPRKIYLEILRGLAVLLVIFNHTGDQGFTYYTTLEPSFRYYLFMACSVLTVMNIPVFFMISGATLIGKEEPISVIWKKRIFKYALVIIIFSMLQYVFLIDFDIHSFSLKRFFLIIFSRNMIVPYWFLYKYLGFLVILPILRKLIKTINLEDMFYILVLYVGFNCALPMVEYLDNGWHIILNSYFDISSFSNDLVVYPMLGYYLSNVDLKKGSKEGKRVLAVLWLLSIASVVFTCIITQTLIGELFVVKEDNVGTFYSSLIIIPTITMFVTIRWIFENRELPSKLSRPIFSFGSCVFGTYLIEQLVREHITSVYYLMAAHMPNFVASVFYVLIIALICWPIVWIMKHIPGLKKLI